jgi:hypothetical protein
VPNARLGLAAGKSKEVLLINKQIENYTIDVEKYYRDMLENKGFSL